MRVIGVHGCLQQLRKDLLESRYADAILLQKRKKGLNRVKIDQVFRVPNSHDRPIQVSVPIFAITRGAGLPDGAAAGISVALQIVAFIAILVVLVRIYGNAYAKSPPIQ